MFSCFRGKTVLVTGHTGFKGAWLCVWLIRLGAKVVGLSDRDFGPDSLFRSLGLESCLEDRRGDVADLTSVKRVVAETLPDFVFHLAAQAVVSKSFEDPAHTWLTNVIGTVNLLSGLRELNKPCVAILITSDKCYQNNEWVWGYRESDRLGGTDPYSGSKAAAELAIKSFHSSFFSDTDCTVRIGVGRAGNVIGGGDWTENRIVPDAIRAWRANKILSVRNVHSTRPWQLVLEPLSGYLTLAEALYGNKVMSGEAFNFGPMASAEKSVGELVESMAANWGGAAEYRIKADQACNFHEAGLLRLNCDKALSVLGWSAILTFEETVEFTTDWYANFARGRMSAEKTDIQIDQYVSYAANRGAKWAH